MISFLIPSRGRPDSLKVALDSLQPEKDNNEALIWLDIDDPKLPEYYEMLKDNMNVTVLVKDRVGYRNGHIMLNALAEKAKYDWFFFFNDDAYMDNPDWLEIFKEGVKQFDPANETVVLNIWGQGKRHNLFPIISRKYFEVCGHFSMGTANDDWVRIVSMRAGIVHHIYNIRPKHRKWGGADDTLIDDTYHDAEAARAQYGHEWPPDRGPNKHILEEDVRKIVEYNQSIKPGLSVLVPTRGRAEHLKLSFDSLGLEQNNLEALLWVDDDDPQLKRYQELFGDDRRIKIFIKPRVGYKYFHDMLNFLASEATSDWFFLWNDDSYMDGPEWYKTFAEHAALVDPKEEVVVFNIWGQSSTDNSFPIISKKYFDLLGHFAPTPYCNLHVQIIANFTKIQRPIFGIKPNHRNYNHDKKKGNLVDETKRDIDVAKQKSRWMGLWTGSMRQKRDVDVKKILAFVKKKDAGFIGLGKLGMPVALAMENRGNRIIGYDVNPDVKDYLEKKEVPFKEAGLPELLASTKLEMEDSIEALVAKTDLIFCAIQTPHDPSLEGHLPLPEERADFDYTYLKKAVSDVSAAADKLNKKITLVVISTCLPGTYKREIKPLLSTNINYVYNPFFIAMGTVVNDFYNPEFTLIGKDDGDITPLQNFYKLTLGDKKEVVTDITTAEGIKVFYNTFITTKTVLGNLYGEFAHKLGMNADHIHEALALATDRLMSPKYIKAGVGDGGGCHPRDNIALAHLAKINNISSNFFEHLMAAREKHMEWLGELLQKEVEISGLPAVILGKSFKPQSNIQTGSSAILLANILKNKGLKFEHYEFDYPPELPQAVYLIATEHSDYGKLAFPKGSVVIDPFRFIPKQEGVNLIPIGAQ